MHCCLINRSFSVSPEPSRSSHHLLSNRSRMKACLTLLRRIVSKNSVTPLCSIPGQQRLQSTSVITDANIDASPVSKHFLNVGFHQDLPKACYGGRHTVAMLTGDGVGPEMMDYVKEVYQLIGAPVDFEEIHVNINCAETTFRDALLAMERNGVGIKGNFATEPGQSSRNLALRTQLNLYAFVQRCRNFPGIDTRHQNVDIVIIRENTEGEYSRLEHENVPGVVESLKVITAEKSRRIAHFAFNYAIRHNRKKVTAVHKANIMKLGDGLFLDTCSDVAKAYPQIEFDAMIIDNTCMQLVSRPQQFDVIVLPNLYGNIVGNIAAGLVGGAGLASGVNLGERNALFEMGTRNSGRSLVGKNLANPCAMLLTAAHLLEYLNHTDEARQVWDAIFHVIGVQRIRTRDLGGQHKTRDVVRAITERIRQNQM
ncbi:isocitrate dehydrogenase (NAD+) [Clonorchis sinensis]|uniref:Isocitrate dehydrogenase [NAD] subunit, mitochondrial n=1 Tax=Clonorchis sinensis TaxID=79923 RepID=H2KQU1_CLOSI|nr:isocitrate dehydrogenase (NAD+) [Clonorchis sinensis]